MTNAQKRKEARQAKAAAEFRALNFHMIGSRHRNYGWNLKVGTEWETPDGFRVRQVDATPNAAERGHFIGTLEVLAFAGKYALPMAIMGHRSNATTLTRTNISGLVR